MNATIDWVATDEPNTPRGKVIWLEIGPEAVSLKFAGIEAGQGSSWGGAIIFKCTVAVQTISGSYEEIPEFKIGTEIKKVPFTVVGRFSDNTYKSFTGEWTEGLANLSVYEFNLDIG